MVPLNERVGEVIRRTGYDRKMLFGERIGKYTLDAQELIEFQCWLQRTADHQAYLEGERLHPGRGHRYWKLQLRMKGKHGI
jgi:hypothetical protein